MLETRTDIRVLVLRLNKPFEACFPVSKCQFNPNLPGSQFSPGSLDSAVSLAQLREADGEWRTLRLR